MDKQILNEINGLLNLHREICAELTNNHQPPKLFRLPFFYAGKSDPSERNILVNKLNERFREALLLTRKEVEQTLREKYNFQI